MSVIKNTFIKTPHEYICVCVCVYIDIYIISSRGRGTGQVPEDSLPLETQKHEDSRPLEDASEVPGSYPKRARHRLLVFHLVFRFVSPCEFACGLELLRAVSSSAYCLVGNLHRSTSCCLFALV